MEKLDRIRVLAPLNLALYVAALWLTGYYPGWGSLVLAVVDIVTIVVIYLIARRYVNLYEQGSWGKMGPWLVSPLVALFVLALIHGIGAVFIRDDTNQRLLAYGSVSFVILAMGVYVMDKFKDRYWAS